ncbi:MAG: carbohydrate kinase family protein [Patescibacteria group bacterium]
MAKNEVVTIGDAFQDLFVFSDDFKVINDRVFKSGKSLSFDYGAKNDIKQLVYDIGGSAVNSAISFSRLGCNCGISTFLGDDGVAEKIKLKLTEENIEFVGKIYSGETNTSIILSCNGDRTILSYHGKNDYGDLPISKSLKTDWFYLAPIGIDFERLENKIIENIAKNGTGLIWNPGPTQIKNKAASFRHLLRLCNILILNREEAFEFSSSGKIEDSMLKLNELGAKLIIITDGKNGSFSYDGKIFYKIDISDDKRIDATGAGDAFGSTFAARAIRKCKEKPTGFVPDREDILESLKWAVANSGSVVSQVGASVGLLKTEAIEDKVGKLVKLEPTLYNK